METHPTAVKKEGLIILEPVKAYPSFAVASTTV